MRDVKPDGDLGLWVVLVRAHQAVARHAEADITSRGVTPGEFAILDVLYHKGPMLLGELQRKVLVSSGGVTYLVDRLEANGLVERRACETDRRARYAALTVRGVAWMDAAFPEHAAVVREVLSGLSAAERKQAITLLRKLGTSAAAREFISAGLDDA